MTKILYIIDNLNIGGAQIHLSRLIQRLSNETYHLELVSLGKDDDIFSNINMPRMNLRMDCIWKPYFWKNFILLIKHIRTIKPTLVHTYLNTANVFGVLAAKIAKVPVIISSRRDMGHFRSGLIGWLESLTGRLSTKIVCVSEAIRQNVIVQEKQEYDKTKVIYNGVDERIFSAKNSVNNNSCINIAMVASMDRKEKGHAYFIEAARMILKERNDIRFFLIGDGPLRLSLEKSINNHKLREYFNFKGKLTNLPEALRDVDLMILPSESEGCSNALLEGMAMGIPAIATAVEGNLEVIEDGISGILVKPKEPVLIAQQILKLLNSLEELKKLGTEARNRILQRFTLNVMINNYTKLYDSLSGQDKVQRIKIGYIVSLFPCWSETFILNEIIEVEKRNFDVTIFSIRRDSETFIQEKAKPFLSKIKYIAYSGLFISFLYWLLRKPYTFINLFISTISKKHSKFSVLSKYAWCILAAGQFARIAQRKKITHLHAHFATYPAFVAMAISRLTGISFSFTAHAHDIFLDKPFLKELIYEAKEVVTISEYNKNYIAEYYKNVMADKIHVIHCGVDTKEFQPVEKQENGNGKVIVSIGRLTEMKGFEYLIKACKIFEPNLAFKCHIVGDGPLRDRLLKLTESLGLTNKVIFEGVLDNNKINSLLNKTDIFAAPSIWSDIDGQEGIPVVLMEAMAKGVPVVASRISGIPELIIDGQTGLLVEPKNEDALAKRILELVNTPELSRNIAKNARIKVQKQFNVSKSADRLVNIFKKKIKVLFVIWSLEKGGAEKFLTALVKTLDKSKVVPTVCCLNWKGEWAKEVENAGVEVIALNKKNGVDLKAFFKLIKLMRRKKFDIVNTQLWESDSLGRIAAIFAGMPIIISTAQNVDLWKKWHHRMIDRILALKTDTIIAVSAAVKDFYSNKIGIPDRKISVIPNAIDLTRFNRIKDTEYLRKELNLTSDDYILICVGRLTEQKGQRYLIKAITLLIDSYPQIKLLLVGSGEDHDKLVKLAKDSKVDKITRFLGQRKDIPELLSISNVLILPSLYEGLPLCVLEAMAAGKPIIATKIGGIEDLIIDIETGLIVPPKDFQALANAIKIMINSPDNSKEMAKKAKIAVLEKYSIKTITEKTTDLFHSLINSR